MSESCKHDETLIGYPATYPAAGWEKGPRQWVCNVCGQDLGVHPLETDHPLFHYHHPEVPLPAIMPELLEEKTDDEPHEAESNS